MDISVNTSSFIPVHTSAENRMIDGEEVLRVVKSEKIYEYDENTYAKVKNVNLKDGVIEVDMMSRLLPDAPDFARGFIGIAFRINEDDTAFESFYIRPTNSINATDDPLRQSHGCQYFAYPKYTFSYFREHGITKYEAPIHYELNQWIHLKAVIKDDTASFYLNHEEQPVLTVEKLLHGKGIHGGIGLFVDIGTEAFFKNIRITDQ